MVNFNIPDPIDIIAPDDDMYVQGQNQHYFNVGYSALVNIIHAMIIAGKSNCENILDIPCGYGRVLRYLKAKFPQTPITACEINRDAVDFCVETFGVNGFYSQKDIQNLDLSEKYDLIWCGSLLTHLDERMWDACLTFFYDHLEEGGLLVFTTHGRYCLKRLHQGWDQYGLDQNEIPSIISSCRNTGFGYLDYPTTPGYGISIASPSWVFAKLQRYLNLKLIYFIEMGWDSHQDVVACLRSSEQFLDFFKFGNVSGPHEKMTGDSFYPEIDQLSEIYFRDVIKVSDGFNFAVHKNDEMFLFLQEQDKDSDGHVFWKYLESGKQMFDVVKQIVEWGFGGFERLPSFLDFACGYGRFMRFLVQEMPAESIWASDIYADAVKFQEEQFGIHGIVSTAAPEGYQNDQNYDCIFVASLFSHLPGHAFVGWLRRLYDLLSPEGLLLFSVHDVAVMSKEYKISPDGLTFIPESESRSLDKDSYGSTYVTQFYVEKVIGEISRHKASFCRIRKGLWDFQDLYIVSRNTGTDFSTLEVNLGPFGSFDHCYLREKREYCFHGWAADFGKDTWIKDVQLIVNGQVVQQCIPLYARPDVAKYYGNESGHNSGWSFCIDKERLSPTDIIMTKTISSKNFEKVLWFGTFQSLLKSRGEIHEN